MRTEFVGLGRVGCREVKESVIKGGGLVKWHIRARYPLSGGDKFPTSDSAQGGVDAGHRETRELHVDAEETMLTTTAGLVN